MNGIGKNGLVSLAVVFALLLPATTFAQQSTSMIGVRRSVATVMFAGLAGAVLGLSTLSFYGEPQDHVGNIWTGLALGALAGTGYIVAQNSKTTTAFDDLQFKPKPSQNARPLFVYNFDF